MYSKEEAQRIKQEFWIEFAKEYPRKWLLHNTKIKDYAFKFYCDNKKAMVLLDIEVKDAEKRKIYFEKMESMKTILTQEYLPDALYERDMYLENGKLISRIWVELDAKISINNRNSWATIFDFFQEKMSAFEMFFYEYEDYLKDLEINT